VGVYVCVLCCAGKVYLDPERQVGRRLNPAARLSRSYRQERNNLAKGSANAVSPGHGIAICRCCDAAASAAALINNGGHREVHPEVEEGSLQPLTKPSSAPRRTHDLCHNGRPISSMVIPSHHIPRCCAPPSVLVCCSPATLLLLPLPESRC
jgi:hypothetical protein